MRPVPEPILENIDEKPICGSANEERKKISHTDSRGDNPPGTQPFSHSFHWSTPIPDGSDDNPVFENRFDHIGYQQIAEAADQYG